MGGTNKPGILQPMSPLDPKSRHAKPVSVFAALGDETRAELVRRLSDGKPQSISQVGDGLGLTRQGVTKHLNVLKDAGLIAGSRHGREMRFVFVPDALLDAQDYLSQVSAKWDDALSRLKSFVEDPPH